MGSGNSGLHSDVGAVSHTPRVSNVGSCSRFFERDASDSLEARLPMHVTLVHTS